MKTLILILVSLVLVACGKESSTTVASPYGTWKMQSGPAGVAATTTFVYNASGSCGLGSGTTPDTCTTNSSNTLLHIKHASDGTTDDYAMTVNATTLTMLQSELDPTKYTYTFSRQ